MTTPIVAARGLTKNYKNRKVLTGLTFELAEGRLHGLLGRNGTGKSTLLSILAGQIPHTGGGLDVFGQAPFDNAHVMDRVGYAGIDVPFPAGWRPTPSSRPPPSATRAGISRRPTISSPSSVSTCARNTPSSPAASAPWSASLSAWRRVPR